MSLVSERIAVGEGLALWCDGLAGGWLLREDATT